MKKKEALSLTELIMPPECGSEALKRKIFAGDFFQNTLLSGIKEGVIEDTEDIYRILREYRQTQNTDVDIGHVFGSAIKRMTSLIQECRLGTIPPDFFETDFAFSLLCDAITKNDRFSQEPGYNDSEIERGFYEILKNAVPKIVQQIELSKEQIGLRRH